MGPNLRCQRKVESPIEVYQLLNAADDAAAIVEAASRPTMHFVTVKSVEQQGMRAVLRF